MRSVPRFVPRFDALESHVCLSDLLSMPASGICLSTSSTTQATIQPLTVPTALPVEPSQSPILLAGGVDGIMPTTPGVNLDVYPPNATYLGVPGMPQVPVSPQDPNGIFNVPFPQYFQAVPQNAPNPMPYYPPPYSVPTYVGLMSVPPTSVT